MKNGRLAFDEAFARLKHSFLQEAHDFNGTWVDFQHPSIRDMLVDLLKADPAARMRYISMASARGLCTLIEAVPLFGSTIESTSHRLVMSSEEELVALCDRLRRVLADTLPARDASKMVETAGLLVPVSGEKKIRPGDADLSQLAVSPCGRILSSLLQAFADVQLFNSNQTWGTSDWTLMLREFYRLAAYVIPPPSPFYIAQLMRKAADSDLKGQVKFYELVSRFELLRFRQHYGSAIDGQLASAMRSLIEKSRTEGKGLSSVIFDSERDEYDANDEWRDEAEGVLSIADSFFEFSPSKPPNGLEHLRQLYEDHEMPDEPEGSGADEYDDDRDWRSGGMDTGWTIEALFEDL
jgi:hypothetical protein